MKSFQNPTRQRYSKFAAMIIVMAFITFFLSANVFASGAAAGGTSDVATNAFNNVMQFLVPWIQKLGGVVMLLAGSCLGSALRTMTRTVKPAVFKHW